MKKLMYNSRNEKYKQRNYLLSLIRETLKYKEWKKEVYENQGRQCQICGSNERTQVHHKTELAKIFDRFVDCYGEDNIYDSDPEYVLELTLYYDELWNVDNGEVLCSYCHSQTHPDKRIWL